MSRGRPWRDRRGCYNDCEARRVGSTVDVVCISSGHQKNYLGGRKRYLEDDAATAADCETSVERAVRTDELASLRVRAAVCLQILRPRLDLRVDNAWTEP